jgi:hypothetical protein
VTAVLNPAEQAAYRALVAYRLNAAQREGAARKVVAALAEVPVELLPGVVNLGKLSHFAHELAPVMWPVTTDRRLDAAAAAIAAAAEVLCKGAES